MNIRIVQLQLAQGSADELLASIASDLAPVLRSCDGFLGYYALAAGDGTVVTVRVFEDEASMDASRETSRTVTEQLAQAYGLSEGFTSWGDVAVGAAFGPRSAP